MLYVLCGRRQAVPSSLCLSPSSTLSTPGQHGSMAATSAPQPHCHSKKRGDGLTPGSRNGEAVLLRLHATVGESTEPEGDRHGPCAAAPVSPNSSRPKTASISQPPSQPAEAVSVVTPNFPEIRHMCVKDKYDIDINTDPRAFAHHRSRTWPHPAIGLTVGEDGGWLAAIYDVVRATGLPNCMGARVPVPTCLNVDAWRKYVDTTTDEADLLEYIQFGFPLGYMGPTSPTESVPNHPSATRFPNEIDHFVSTEKAAGALIGPFSQPPFTSWVHVFPLMSRPKTESDKRRDITDLTFPTDKSVNAYIMKNSALGQVREHTLPSVANLSAVLKRVGSGAFLFTLDIARVYKNFTSDPLDWPLLCLRWGEAYYMDVSMPFGARASSCFMQRVANCFTRILRAEGIEAIMYLDDVVVVAPDLDTALAQYVRVKSLFAELGLPEGPPRWSDGWAYR